MVFIAEMEIPRFVPMEKSEVFGWPSAPILGSQFRSQLELTAKQLQATFLAKLSDAHQIIRIFILFGIITNKSGNIICLVGMILRIKNLMQSWN
jgi:hypothetical protein